MSSTPVVTGRRTQELCVDVDFGDFQACLFEEYEDFVDQFELYREEGICSALEFLEELDEKLGCSCDDVDLVAIIFFGVETIEELEEDLDFLSPYFYTGYWYTDNFIFPRQSLRCLFLSAALTLIAQLYNLQLLNFCTPPLPVLNNLKLLTLQGFSENGK